MSNTNQMANDISHAAAEQANTLIQLEMSKKWPI